jgi:hypothetical protein
VRRFNTTFLYNHLGRHQSSSLVIIGIVGIVIVIVN